MYRSYEANVLATRVTTDRGQYVLIAELTPPPLSERIPGDLLWTLKLGTIFSAIICLLIAHYLTKPIERLRDATHELARGNLDIRAGENLGNRHDEIADLVRDFDTMAGELRNQIQSERNLLSGVSHELRSPIARIRLALALARHADDPERVEMLDRIEQDTIQLDSMLERILTVARLESGQQKPKFEPLSLNDVMDDVLHDANFEAAATGATIHYQNSSEIKVNGDATLLRSAVENIVRNAVFYSGEGGKIDVSLEKANGAAVISVRDNGPGVPENALATALQAVLPRGRFARDQHRRHGTGIGHRAQCRGHPRRQRVSEKRVPARTRSRTALADDAHSGWQTQQRRSTVSAGVGRRSSVCALRFSFFAFRPSLSALS